MILRIISCFQLPCSRSRANLTSPTNDGAAGAPVHVDNCAEIASSQPSSGFSRGHSLTVANGVHDGRRRTLSLMAPETPPPVEAPPTTSEGSRRARSPSEAVFEEDDSTTAAVLFVPVETTRSPKKRKKRRGREDATDSIVDDAGEPIFSKDTVV